MGGARSRPKHGKASASAAIEIDLATGEGDANAAIEWNAQVMDDSPKPVAARSRNRGRLRGGDGGRERDNGSRLRKLPQDNPSKALPRQFLRSKRSRSVTKICRAFMAQRWSA